MNSNPPPINAGAELKAVKPDPRVSVWYKDWDKASYEVYTSLDLWSVVFKLVAKWNSILDGKLSVSLFNYDNFILDDAIALLNSQNICSNGPFFNINSATFISQLWLK